MEDFVTYELAVKLKEKEFNEACVGHYVNNQLYIAHPINAFHSNDDRSIDAPTISQVLKWLRDKKKIYVGVSYMPKVEDSNDFYYPAIQKIGSFEPMSFGDTSHDYDNWEDAAVAGITYTLDNLI